MMLSSFPFFFYSAWEIVSELINTTNGFPSKFQWRFGGEGDATCDSKFHSKLRENSEQKKKSSSYLPENSVQTRNKSNQRKNRVIAFLLQLFWKILTLVRFDRLFLLGNHAHPKWLRGNSWQFRLPFQLHKEIFSHNRYIQMPRAKLKILPSQKKKLRKNKRFFFCLRTEIRSPILETWHDTIKSCRAICDIWNCPFQFSSMQFAFFCDNFQRHNRIFFSTQQFLMQSNF